MTQKLRNNRTPPEKALWRTSSLYISYSNVLRILRGFIQPSTDGLDLAKLVMTTISAIITKVIRCQPVLSLMMWCCLGHRDDWDSCLVYWHSVRSLYISVCIYVCMFMSVGGLWARWYRGWQNGLRPITTPMKQARYAAALWFCWLTLCFLSPASSVLRLSLPLVSMFIAYGGYDAGFSMQWPDFHSSHQPHCHLASGTGSSWTYCCELLHGSSVLPFIWPCQSWH